MNLDADDFNMLYPVGSKVQTRWGGKWIYLTKKPAVVWRDGISRVVIELGDNNQYPCELAEIVRVIPDASNSA
jgi:hypothetical protein